MKKLMITALVVVVAAGLAAAQGKTSTDFGAAAAAGTNTAAQSVAKDTPLGRGINVRAWVPGASAHSSASQYRGWLRVHEHAYVKSDGKTAASAGTTTTKTGNIGDAHAVETTVKVAQNTAGNVKINWSYYGSSSGVTLKAVVNVDGKDVATFTETSKSTSTSVPITAGPNGVTIKITTAGMAAMKTMGYARYSAGVSARFEGPSTNPTPCTLTPFGKACGLTLTGKTWTSTRFGTRHHVSLTIGGTSQGSGQYIIVGTALTTPVKLPGGCDLWVTPQTVIPLGTRTSTVVSFPASAPFTTSMQAASVTFDAQGIKISTSDGLTLKCP